MTNRVVAFVSARSRREQLIIAAVAVFLIIVAAVIALGGGGAKEESGDVGPRLSPRATPTPTTTAPPITSGGFEGRDPFIPLVVPAVTGGGGSPGGSGTGSSGGPTGPNPTGAQQRVTLVDIFSEDGERMATVSVGDEQFTVAEGETFADNFQVVTITKQCATFLFGDERFTLCIGQEVRK